VVQLRGVERADLDALFALDQECFRPGIAYSRSDLRFYLSHPRSLSIIAEDDWTKAILGFIIAETYLEHARRIGHIITIDVAPSERRKGLGRTLMQAMLDRLNSAGTAMLRLEVAIDNIDAQTFYRSLGFSQTGRIRGFYLGRLDALVMEKSVGPGSDSAPDATSGM
jgi:[ribosomal protein S18]-alanine N-acetyltransferase